MTRFIKLIYNFIRSRIYLDESIMLYRHKNLIKIDSEATLVEVDEHNLMDALAFESRSSYNYMTRMYLKGEKGILGYVDGKCVHRSWIKDTKGKALLYKFLQININEQDVYIHDCATAPDMRGKNIYPFVLSYIAEKYKSSKKILIATSQNNESSVKGILKAGFIPIEKHCIKVVLGIKKRKVERINS
ncbi:MAG TPA: hypothetical protein VMW76_06770 [Bacteroidales bacterium]|nr:hypothetical protein [Bacteroidales bacterium]